MNTSATSSPERQAAVDFCLMSALMLLVVIVFSRVFGSEFVFDNSIVIGRDMRLNQLSAENLADIFTKNYWWPSMESSLYRPVATLLFLIQNCVLGFGGNPAGYQLVNLALHGGVVIAAFTLLVKMQISRVHAFWACALFAIHPYVTEVIPNIVGLSDILALLSMLLAFHVYLDVLERRVALGVGLCAFTVTVLVGVLSKESAVSILALVFWHSCTIGRAQAREYFWGSRLRLGRLLMVGGAFAVVLVAVVVPKMIHKDFDLGEGLDMVIVDNPLRGESALVARVNAFSILGGNMINCIVPTTISADYSSGQIPLGRLPPSSVLDWTVLARAVGVLLFGALGLCMFWRWPALSFGIGAVFINAMPTANVFLLIGTIRADRLVYSYILPVWICAGMLGYALFHWITSRGSCMSNEGRAFWKRGGFIVGVVLVLLLGLISNFRSTDWRTAKGFWEAAYQTSPGSFKTKLGLAGISEDEDLARVNNSLALVRESLAQLAESPFELIRRSDFALETCAGVLSRRAKIYKEAGRIDECRADLDEAFSLYSEVLQKRKEFDKWMAAARLHAGRAPSDELVKKDNILVAMSEILRFRHEYAHAKDLLMGYYDECLLSAEYMKELARIEVDMGDWATGLRHYVKIALLYPDDASVAAEASWVLKNKVLPPGAVAYAVGAEKKYIIPPEKLNFGNEVLLGFVKDGSRELSQVLSRKGKLTERAVMFRRIRVYIGVLDVDGM